MKMVSYWGSGATDTSSTPAYIVNGSTATWGVGYTSSNTTNGKAGVSGRSDGGSAPHYWNANVMLRWKKWVDYLASKLLPGGVRYPGFFGISVNESTWALQSANNVNAGLINQYGGNQGYGYGNQQIYYDQLKYLQSKFPGIPIWPCYNGPDAGGANATTLLRGFMDKLRSEGLVIATGERDAILPKTGAYHDHGQWVQTTAGLYTAYWPPTERSALAVAEDPDPMGTQGDRNTVYWQDIVDDGCRLRGWDVFSYALTHCTGTTPPNPTYPTQNWTTDDCWTVYFKILRDATTPADCLTHQ
jgi:hypothetical protein